MNLTELAAHDWTVYTEAELTRRLNQAHADRRRARSYQAGNFYAALIDAVEAELTARRSAPASGPRTQLRLF